MNDFDTPQPLGGLGLYFKGDITRILAGIEEAMSDTASMSGQTDFEMEAYQRGFRAALRAIRIVIGLPLPSSPRIEIDDLASGESIGTVGTMSVVPTIGV